MSTYHASWHLRLADESSAPWISFYPVFFFNQYESFWIIQVFYVNISPSVEIYCVASCAHLALPFWFVLRCGSLIQRKWMGTALHLIFLIWIGIWFHGLHHQMMADSCFVFSWYGNIVFSSAKYCIQNGESSNCAADLVVCWWVCDSRVKAPCCEFKNLAISELKAFIACTRVFNWEGLETCSEAPQGFDLDEFLAACDGLNIYG